MSTNDRVSSSNLSKQRDAAHSACAGVDTVFRVDRGEFKSLNSFGHFEVPVDQWTEHGRCKIAGDGIPLGFMPRWIVIDISNCSNFFYGIVFDLFSNRCRNLEFLFISVAFNLMFKAEQFEKYL